VKTLFVFGTRPEAIKMAPVIRAARRYPEIEVCVCVTGQHREMLQQMLAFFRIVPDYDLDVMRPSQDLGGLTARILDGIRPVLLTERPDLVLVQGDTVTAFAAALAAFYQRIPVGHVEAGLRTYDLDGPFPEEGMRQMVTRLAAFHFAPTQGNAETLIREGVAAKTIFLTGNPVIDSALWTRDRLRRSKAPPLAAFTSEQNAGRIASVEKLILATSHRRENFGDGLRGICGALAEVANEFHEALIAFPVHPNPNVSEPVHRMLGPLPNVILLPPVDYPAFVYLMDRSRVIVTDSGGVQEEAPALGKPVLVTREATERREGVTSGLIHLVGTSRRSIVLRLRDFLACGDKSATNPASPYGDGRAGEKIVDAIRKLQQPDGALCGAFAPMAAATHAKQAARIVTPPAASIL
jgi:UDP-N-acetylglucosamine 2-epimerase (non-hydrolysing)